MLAVVGEENVLYLLPTHKEYYEDVALFKASSNFVSLSDLSDVLQKTFFTVKPSSGMFLLSLIISPDESRGIYWF